MAAILDHFSSETALPERSLRSFHIFMITVSGVIGVGFASNASEIMGIVGPGGTILAFGVVGIVSCCVMEGICEMLVHWAIPNPMVEFVRVFVDRDLAIVVGFAYWYTYSITFVALIITTGNLIEFWSLSFAWKTAIFFIVTIALALINCSSVLTFGIIESFGGCVKLALITGLFILMILLDTGVGPGEPIGFTCFNDGVRYNPNVASSHFEAVLIAISLAVFPYLGVEMVTVTAFEARDPNTSLRFTAKNIAYIVTVIYVLSVFAFGLNVEWFNSALPEYYQQPLVDQSLGASFLGHKPLAQFLPGDRSFVLPVIAALQSGLQHGPGIITAILAYSALSSANTALYIASRTLYGLTQTLDPDSHFALARLLSRLGTVTPGTKIPGWALLASLMFFWLPYINLGATTSREEFQQILVSLGSTSCILVWASQCFAFIRFHKWRKIHKDYLRGEQFGKYHPRNRPGFSSWFAFLQPLPAWAGFIGCILIVFVFASVGMANRQNLKIKVLNIYLGPAIFLALFILLKVINFKRKGWVTLGDWNALRTVLLGLEGQQHQQRANIPAPIRPGSPAGSGMFESISDAGDAGDTEMLRVTPDRSSTHLNPELQGTFPEPSAAPLMTHSGRPNLSIDDTRYHTHSPLSEAPSNVPSSYHPHSAVTQPYSTPEMSTVGPSGSWLDHQAVSQIQPPLQQQQQQPPPLQQFAAGYHQQQQQQQYQYGGGSHQYPYTPDFQPHPY